MNKRQRALYVARQSGGDESTVDGIVAAHDACALGLRNTSAKWHKIRIGHVLVADKGVEALVLIVAQVEAGAKARKVLARGQRL